MTPSGRRLPPFIDLTRAEALRALPEGLWNAAGRAVGQKESYAPAAGQDEVRAAVAAYLQRRWNVTVPAEEVVVTAGATMAVASSLLALTEPGDPVLLPVPGYPGPRRCSEVLGRVTVGYDPADLAAPESLPFAEARAMAFMNPQNPSGRVLPPAALAELVRSAVASGVALVCDAAFLDFTWSGGAAGGLPPIGSCVTVGSLGKSTGLPNLRIGWARAEPAVAKRIAQKHWALAMSAGAGNAAIAASLIGGSGWVDEVVADAGARLSAGLAAAAAEGLDIPHPEGGLCVCVPLAGLPFGAAEATKRMAEDWGVGVRPASFFYGPTDDWVRLGLAETKEETQEGYARVARFVRQFAR